MAPDRTVADARLKMLNSELLRGLALYTLGRSEDLRDENRAMRAEIRQRRLAEARDGPPVQPAGSAGRGAALTTATPAMVIAMPSRTSPLGTLPSTTSSSTATTGDRNIHVVAAAGSSQRRELK